LAVDALAAIAGDDRPVGPPRRRLLHRCRQRCCRPPAATNDSLFYLIAASDTRDLIRQRIEQRRGLAVDALAAIAGDDRLVGPPRCRSLHRRCQRCRRPPAAANDSLFYLIAASDTRDSICPRIEQRRGLAVNALAAIAGDNRPVGPPPRGSLRRRCRRCRRPPAATNDSLFYLMGRSPATRRVLLDASLFDAAASAAAAIVVIVSRIIKSPLAGATGPLVLLPR
jgi:hypothetical protein